MKRRQFSPKQYSNISLKTANIEAETPIFMSNNGLYYYLLRSVPYQQSDH